MYKVISANRGSHKAPKNWRVFEKENMEGKLREKVRRNNKLVVEVQGAIIVTSK